MALQPDLYAAFSRALGSAGMDSADHSAISQAMADDITSAITSCIRSAVTTTSYTGITLVPPGVGAVAVGIDITAMAYLSIPISIALFGAFWMLNDLRNKVWWAEYVCFGWVIITILALI